MIKALAAKGGVIQINYHVGFLNEEFRNADKANPDMGKAMQEEIKKRCGNQGRQDRGESRVPVSSKPSQAGSRPDGARQPVTIRADRLEYLDVERKAAYRGHVRMESAGTTLNCDRLDASFTESAADAPSELDHAVADGNVVLFQAGRRGLGQHADYFGREGKVVITGGPPSLYDAQKGFTTGRTLTFFTQDDSLIIEGGSGFRFSPKHRLSR